jgi:formiminotetrahydrofolate cyclodeaminase
MKLRSMSVGELLAAFRSFEPTPGGGSAAALAGAVGASLLAMVAGLPKPKADSADGLAALGAAGDVCTRLALRLESLIDEDSAAYDGVVAAFRLPKVSDAEKAARTAAIQDAMKAATESPLEVMRGCAEALAQLPLVAGMGNPNASSDVEVARAMLTAGLRGGHLNIETNLGSIKDADYIGRVRREAETLLAKAV